MTETTRRPRLISNTAIIATAVIVTVIVSALIVSYMVARSRLVEAPDVTGLTLADAEADLLEAGLQPQQVSTQVSADVPAGSIISQSPKPGTALERGSFIKLVVSAGPQTYVVPDLIGSPVEGAEDALVALGFVVVIDRVSSETTEAIVLEMYPAPGASVSVGDEIRLSVPGDADTSDGLLPYDLDGIAILLDPQPAPSNVTADAPMEVARRLHALLEAAGATVTSTRTSSAVAPSPTERETTATASTADILIGLDLGSKSVAGVTVYHLPDGTKRAEESARYAQAVTRAATLPGLTVNEPLPTTDPVLTRFRGPGIRVVVGDSGVDADRARFSDPEWADQIARAIYRGIGTSLAAQ